MLIASEGDKIFNLVIPSQFMNHLNGNDSAKLAILEFGLEIFDAERRAADPSKAELFQQLRQEFLRIVPHIIPDFWPNKRAELRQRIQEILAQASRQSKPEERMIA